MGNRKPRTVAVLAWSVGLALGSLAGGAGPVDAVEGTGSSFAVRSSAAWRDVVDAAGRVWSARRGLVGGDAVARDLVGKDVRGTVDDQLYWYSTLDTTGFTTWVPAAGRYRVTVKMAEGWFEQAGERVFDIKAEGQPKLTGIDIAAAVGRGVAYDREFDVDVVDGAIDLQFVKRVNHPLVAAVQVIPTPTLTPTPTPPRTAIRLNPNSFYLSRVDSAPLDPNSPAMVDRLRHQVTDYWNGVAAFNHDHYNTAFYTVPAGQPRVDVAFVDCQNKGYLPSGLYDGAAHFRNVPVPPDAIPAAGSDAELTVYSPETDQIWEFWQARKASTGWQACWGGRIDRLSGNLGIFPIPYGATATGLVMAGGMISLDDVRRGAIEHSMYLAVRDLQRYPNISWPALRGDGNLQDPNVVREGQRLRLDPTLDLSRYPLTPIGRMIAKAAQRYGFVVTDRGGAVAVVTESGAREAAMQGVDPWVALMGGRPAYTILEGFPWDRMQVIQADYGRP